MSFSLLQIFNSGAAEPTTPSLFADRPSGPTLPDGGPAEPAQSLFADLVQASQLPSPTMATLLSTSNLVAQQAPVPYNPTAEAPADPPLSTPHPLPDHNGIIGYTEPLPVPPPGHGWPVPPPESTQDQGQTDQGQSRPDQGQEQPTLIQGRPAQTPVAGPATEPVAAPASTLRQNLVAEITAPAGVDRPGPVRPVPPTVIHQPELPDPTVDGGVNRLGTQRPTPPDGTAPPVPTRPAGPVAEPQQNPARPTGPDAALQRDPGRPAPPVGVNRPGPVPPVPISTGASANGDPGTAPAMDQGPAARSGPPPAIGERPASGASLPPAVDDSADASDLVTIRQTDPNRPNRPNHPARRAVLTDIQPQVIEQPDRPATRPQAPTPMPQTAQPATTGPSADRPATDRPAAAPQSGQRNLPQQPLPTGELIALAGQPDRNRPAGDTRPAVPVATRDHGNSAKHQMTGTPVRPAMFAPGDPAQILAAHRPNGLLGTPFEPVDPPEQPIAGKPAPAPAVNRPAAASRPAANRPAPIANPVATLQGPAPLVTNPTDPGPQQAVPQIAGAGSGATGSVAGPEAPTGNQPASATAQSAALAAAVGAEMIRRAAIGQSRFEIRLDPPELGRVDVRMTVADDGTVRAHLIVERTETLDMFTRDRTGLERVLEQSGYRAEDGGLQFSLKQQSAGHDNRSWTRGDDRPAPADDNPADREPDPQSQESASLSGSDRLDIRI